jgi:hypothetical protein
MNLATTPAARGPKDITGLILTGQHALLRIGTHLDALRPFLLWPSAQEHPNGTPIGGDVAFDGVRFCIGLDNSACLSYWVLKRSLQDRSVLLTAEDQVIRLDDVDAFGLLRELEVLRVPYAREIWQNTVCVVTILQSGITISFDLEPAGIKGFATIELGAEPVYQGGDVFRRTVYDRP